MEFTDDGKMSKSFNDDVGFWKPLDGQTLTWMNEDEDYFTVKFNDFGTEAILIDP